MVLHDAHTLVCACTANASQEEVKMLKVTQPESYRASMSAGGAKFGPQFGGESSFQVSADIAATSTHTRVPILMYRYRVS